MWWLHLLVRRADRNHKERRAAIWRVLAAVGRVPYIERALPLLLVWKMGNRLSGTGFMLLVGDKAVLSSPATAREIAMFDQGPHEDAAWNRQDGTEVRANNPSRLQPGGICARLRDAQRALAAQESSEKQPEDQHDDEGGHGEQQGLAAVTPVTAAVLSLNKG
jgi:hypothetical protein